MSITRQVQQLPKPRVNPQVEEVDVNIVLAVTMQSKVLEEVTFKDRLPLDKSPKNWKCKYYIRKMIYLDHSTIIIR